MNYPGNSLWSKGDGAPAGKLSLLAAVMVMASALLAFSNKYVSNSSRKSHHSEDYQLVWADEFNKDGKPDTANWNFEKGFVRNEELQWYQQENARCEKGFLVIEARRASRSNPNYKTEGNDWRNRQMIGYTSASIHTSGRRSWKYGRFLMRGKIDISKGMWPAWWTLGIAGEWPFNGEIDIMEYYSKKLLANVALGDNGRYKAKWFTTIKNIDTIGGEAWAAKFHIWRMDWDEHAIALYVDDQLLNKVNMDELTNNDGTGINPFKQPHYMLLNLAVGGINGGDPESTRFPKRFEVDYVRVYQKK